MPTVTPASDNCFTASRRSSIVAARGSILLRILSSSVDIVTLTSSIVRVAISESMSRSRKIRFDFVIKLGVGIVSEVFMRVARETVGAGMLTAAIRACTPIKRQELLVEVMQKGLAFNWLIEN